MSLMFLLAQESATESSVDSFFKRLVVNDTLQNTSLIGWSILLAAIFGGVVAGKIISSTIRNIALRLETRNWLLRSIIVRSFAGPANLAVVGLGISIGLGSLARSPQLDAFAPRGLALIYIISGGWLLYNLTDLIEYALRSLTSKTASKLDDQLVPLVTKTTRVFLMVLVALFMADNVFGANIGAWLAGLGIAGLAVSLAAQDSLKNIFGSVTILLDQPFQVGDVVTVGGTTGTVEEVGFRSTRIRTHANSLVTIPNSKVADSEIENLARRKYIRRVLDISVTYDTPPAKMEQGIEIVKEIFALPEIASGFSLEEMPPRVVFDELRADSLNIKVIYWFAPVDYWQYMAHAQRFNLELMKRFEAAGIDFAFPTQTLYLAGDKKRPLAIEGGRATGSSNA